MRKILFRSFVCCLTLVLLLPQLLGCTALFLETTEAWHFEGENDSWTFGYGVRPILSDGEGLYMAGYHNDWVGSGYLDRKQLSTYADGSSREFRPDPDYAEAKAVWMDAGEGGVLLIGIDCIALASTVVQQIQDRLFTLCAENNCVSVQIYATHCHALPDTLGLWGPVGIDGKNDSYMDALVTAAVSAAKQAFGAPMTGTLHYGKAQTEGLLYDSRDPQIYDDTLYQLRFAPAQKDEDGVRLLFYGAHAESMRGDNTLFSRDFPGVLCDVVEQETGDLALYVPGAIGGLIYTTDLSGEEEFDAVVNMERTGVALAEYALSITPADEVVIPPTLSAATTTFTAPMDNPLYMYLKFLGVLDNAVIAGDSETGYLVESSLSVLQLGDLTIACLPGEIFPELVYGGEAAQHGTGVENPPTLSEIAAGYGVGELLVIGLCNDELGYIVPPSDFLVHPDTPYLTTIQDETGENHYEETNSLGPATAQVIAEAFATALAEMQAS